MPSCCSCWGWGSDYGMTVIVPLPLPILYTETPRPVCGRSCKVTLTCLGYPWGEVCTQSSGMKPLSSGSLRDPSIQKEPLPVETCMLL